MVLSSSVLVSERLDTFAGEIVAESSMVVFILSDENDFFGFVVNDEVAVAVVVLPLTLVPNLSLLGEDDSVSMANVVLPLTLVVRNTILETGTVSAAKSVNDISGVDLLAALEDDALSLAVSVYEGATVLQLPVLEG